MKKARMVMLTWAALTAAGMLFLGPDLFLQRDLIGKKDYALKAALLSPLRFSPIPIPEDRYPHDRVVPADHFRAEDAAYGKYETGRKMEIGENAAKTYGAYLRRLLGVEGD